MVSLHNAIIHQTKTIMNENAKNLAIYNGLVNHANEVLNHLVINVGIYTAKQVAKENRGFDDGDFAEKMFEVTVENFSCEVKACSIFGTLEKFEKLVKPADRVTFEVKAEKGEPIVEFEVPKEIKYLFKSVATPKSDPLRPALYGICLDTKFSALVATNSSVINVVSVEVTRHEEVEQEKFLIPVEVFKGAEKVTIERGKYGYTANGIGLIEYKFPMWEKVISDFSAEQAINVKKFSDLTKAAKSVTKISGSDDVKITGTKCEKRITLESECATKKIELSAPLMQDVSFTTNKNFLEKVVPGEIYVKGSGQAVSIAEGMLTIFWVESEMEKNDAEMPFNAIEAAGIWKKEKFAEKEATTLPAVVEKYDYCAIAAEIMKKRESENSITIPMKKETKNFPVPYVEKLPTVVVEMTPVAMEEETLEIEDAEAVEFVEETPAKEIVNINGMKEGDYVKLTLPFGDEIICRIYHFSKNGEKVSVNLKGWNKFSFPIESISPTTETKNTMPEWLTVGSTITDGEIIGEIAEIKRSKILFEDGTTATLKDVLVTFHPCENPQEIEEEKSTVRMPKKTRPFGWLRRVLNKVALLSF